MFLVRRIAKASGAVQAVVLFPGALGLAGLFLYLHLPAALMLGPLVAGGVMGANGATIRVPKVCHQFGQGIAGCLIAQYLDAAILGRMLDLWPTVVLFVVLTMGAACIAGLLAARWSGLGRQVTLWGFLPGMAGMIIALSHEKGLDSRMVAFIQLLRLMVVIVSMVLATMALVGPAVSQGGSHAETSPMAVLVCVGLALAGAGLGRFVPMAATFFPLAGAAALNAHGALHIVVPLWLAMLAYLAIGAQVGLRVTPALIRAGVAAFVPVLGAAVILMVLCGAAGLVLSLATGVDLMSGLLATVPGSVDSIALLAIGSGSDVSFVMTMQVVRMLTVAILGPLVADRLARWGTARGGD